MELAGTCRCCRTGIGCDCRSALVQFLTILQTTDQRVSTAKLTIELDQPVSIESLRIAARREEFSINRTRLRDGKWYLELLGGAHGFYTPIVQSQTQEFFWKLITRPSAFGNFVEYQNALHLIVSPAEVATARIQRLDLAVDYQAPLTEILKSLDIPHKRSRVAFMDEGSTRTGIMVGKGNEKIIAYDKAKQKGIAGPLTRIELQLRGKKLPTRKMTLLK